MILAPIKVVDGFKLLKFAYSGSQGFQNIVCQMCLPCGMCSNSNSSSNTNKDKHIDIKVLERSDEKKGSEKESSSQRFRGITADTTTYKLSKLDKWILVKFGPQGRYKTADDVPLHVGRIELDNAKSRARIALNLCCIAAGLLAAFCTVQYGKLKRARGDPSWEAQNMEKHRQWKE